VSVRIVPSNAPERAPVGYERHERGVPVTELLEREGRWDPRGLHGVPARRRVLGAAAGMLVAVGAFSAAYGQVAAPHTENVMALPASAPRGAPAVQSAGKPPAAPAMRHGQPSPVRRTASITKPKKPPQQHQRPPALPRVPDALQPAMTMIAEFGDFVTGR
jgi:hypothetical protein